MNKKLIIIGNGFDIDHRLGTTYKKIFGENEVFQKWARDSQKIYHISSANIEIDWNNFEEILGRIADAYRSWFSTKKMTEDTMTTAVVNAQFEIYQALERFASFCEGRDDAVVNDLFFEWDSDEYYRDKTIVIKEILIKEIKKVYEIKFEAYEKYLNFFVGNFQVVNYNYTKVHEIEFGNSKYYSSDKCIYIHGVIDKNTSESVDTRVGASNFSDIGEIKLGVYANQLPISSDQIYPNFKIKASKKRQEEIADSFWENIGNGNLDFRKENRLSPHDKWPLLEKLDFDSFDELVILGHSMSKNDMERFTLRIKLKNVKTISIIGWWEDERDVENYLNLIDFFVKKCEIKDGTAINFINNYPHFCKNFKIVVRNGGV